MKNQALQYDSGKYYYIEDCPGKDDEDWDDWVRDSKIKSTRIEVAPESEDTAMDLLFTFREENYELKEGIYPVQVKVNYKYTKKPPYRYAILSELEKVEMCGEAHANKQAITVIPSKFKIFASEIKVRYDNERLSYEGSLGESSFNQLNEICLVNKYKGEPLDQSVILDTFYHEKVHIILHAMGEHDLSKNEKFVEIFSRLLRQSDESAEFDN